MIHQLKLGLCGCSEHHNDRNTRTRLITLTKQNQPDNGTANNCLNLKRNRNEVQEHALASVKRLKYILLLETDIESTKFPRTRIRSPQFPLDLIHSDCVGLLQVSRALDNSKRLKIRTNSWLHKCKF